MSARVCFVVGARPNFMKSAPVYRELAALDPSLELVLLHTGQHYDDAMSDVFFRELGMPRPDEFLAVGSGTHAEQTAKVLVGIERVLLEHEIDLCVVAGDVNSTIAAALAAVKLGIPIAHIEAGLRSFDRAMPEEHNRVLTDHLSDILLAHSEEAITNLQREGITIRRPPRRQHDDRHAARAPRQGQGAAELGAVRAARRASTPSSRSTAPRSSTTPRS